MELKDLVGAHTMEHAARTDVRHPFDHDKDGILFELDGVFYMVFEDQNDGYRSCAGPVFVCKGSAEYEIGGNLEYINRQVVVRHVTKSEHGGDDSDVIEIIDAHTGHSWLRVGTDNVGDYYPSFVCAWCPMPEDTVATKA